MNVRGVGLEVSCGQDQRGGAKGQSGQGQRGGAGGQLRSGWGWGWRSVRVKVRGLGLKVSWGQRVGLEVRMVRLNVSLAEDEG